jgi:hypothetical protein
MNTTTTVARLRQFLVVKPQWFLPALVVALLVFPSPGRGQEPEVERPGPPPLDELEKDANRDGVPDGWYNARDAIWEAKGGIAGPHFVRFESPRRGRPARLSRAFGVDGRNIEAIVLSFWIRLSNIQYGERNGEEPSLLIDFLGEELRQVSRGTMGPWTHTVGSSWTRVSKRFPVPTGTRDAIMSLGLMGAKGIMDFDGLTIDLVPLGEQRSTNLVVNGDFELGDPAPTFWIVNNDAYRVFPGHRSGAAIELSRSDSRVLTGLALPVEGLGELSVTLYAEGRNLRGSGGADAAIFFLDNLGRPIPQTEVDLGFAWAGTFDWRRETAEVRVPPGARRAVIQFEKTDNLGKIRIDDVIVNASPNPEVASWVPFHEADDTDDWLKVPPSPSIAANSALDFSFLIPAPAGRKGFVTVKEGRLAWEKGGRAYFHGVSLIPPTAFLEPDQADQLADRLARSGLNLVRLGDLDTAFGPDRSLFDDTRDDTKQFDPNALKRLDHLVAALKARGVHVALELQSNRRFRDNDGVALAGLLPLGGGPAALFDPALTKLSLQSARAVLGRVNTETGLTLKKEPALAWVTLLGEVSLFDLIDRPEDAVPGEYALALRALGQKSTIGIGRRFWQSLEVAHYTQAVEALRADKLKVPIAGCSHWRREPEFAAGLATAPLNLVDDRLFWSPSTFTAPEMRSQLWSTDGGLSAGARRKRNPSLPYAVGQWCPQTMGAWALPHEAADQLLAAVTAVHEDWDALVRRGIFLFPLEWGAGPAGTAGGEDIFQVPEAVNSCPHVYALWPHVASIMLRRGVARTDPESEREAVAAARNQAATRRKARGPGAPGWDPARGRLVIETPYTQGIAGWIGSEPAAFPSLDVSSDTPFAVVVASSASQAPISSTTRLLVTAVGRVEPTGFRWVDRFKREVADPGRPPFLQEPVLARVAWRRKGTIKGYMLNNAGERIGPAKLEALPDTAGVTLIVDGKTPAFHWELSVE